MLEYPQILVCTKEYSKDLKKTAKDEALLAEAKANTLQENDKRKDKTSSDTERDDKDCPEKQTNVNPTIPDL